MSKEKKKKKFEIKKKRDENEKIAENLHLNAFACLSTPALSLRQFGQFAGDDDVSMSKQ